MPVSTASAICCRVERRCFLPNANTPARPEFEVASIRLHSNADNRALVQALNGRLVITNFSLKQLILFAYGFPSNQVSGVRPWMDSGRYDLQATTEGGESVSQMEGPMLQALLEDRFNLKVHREMEERPVYELTIEKGGLKMQLSKPGSCTPYSMDSPPRHLRQALPTPTIVTFHISRAMEPTGHSTGPV